MKRITQSKLNKILINHALWLQDHTKGAQAQLINVDLRGLNVGYKALTGADLRGADLRGLNLSYTDLTGADLTGADLTGADLTGADLRGLNLSYTDLTGADLTGADLTGAILDFASWSLSCRTLSAKIDNRLIVQLLYHASIPAQRNKLELEADIIKLFNSKLFKSIVNKFHRVNECGIFEGIKKK